MENNQFEMLCNEISSLRQAVNEIAEYLKYKEGREISFHLNCINSGLDDREISTLFLFYCNETEDKTLSELEKFTRDPEDLIVKSKMLIKKLENVSDVVIGNIIEAFMYNYAIRRLLEE